MAAYVEAAYGERSWAVGLVAGVTTAANTIPPAMRYSHRAGFMGSPAPIYFDQFLPSVDSGRPHVVMVHGGSHTGSCYLLTADGRPGWAYRFADAGFPVTVPDWPGHGRSGGALLDVVTGELVSEALAALVRGLRAPTVLLTHSMGAAFGWRVAEVCRDQVVHVIAVAPAAPGNAAARSSVRREDDAVVEVDTPTRTVSIPKRHRSRASLQMIKTKLVGSSSQFPVGALESYANLVSPTAARLVYERLNVEGSQLHVDDPRRLEDIPITIVTGGDDIDHPEHVDRALAEWWTAQGVPTSFVWLPSLGIEGNGHMLMIESNSDQVADLLMSRLLS